MITLLLLVSAICLQHVGVSGDTCDDAIEIFDGFTTFNTSENSDSGYSVESNCDLMGIMYNDIWFSYHLKLRNVPILRLPLGFLNLPVENVQPGSTSLHTDFNADFKNHRIACQYFSDRFPH